MSAFCSISILGDVCLQLLVTLQNSILHSTLTRNCWCCQVRILYLQNVHLFKKSQKTHTEIKYNACVTRNELSLSSRRCCPDRGSILHRTVTWPSTPHLCSGPATQPSTLTFDPSWVRPGVGSHSHNPGFREGSVGRYCWESPQGFSCCLIHSGFHLMHFIKHNKPDSLMRQLQMTIT